MKLFRLAALALAVAPLCLTATAAPKTASKGKSAKMDKKTTMTEAELYDEQFVTQFGDTSIPKGRKEEFFWDETDKLTSPTEKVQKQLTAAADAVSSASNVAWLKDHGHAEWTRPEFPGVKIKLGDEVLFEDSTYTQLLKGKRIGLITNATGMDSRFVSTIDKLAGSSDWKLTALFAPEHGIRGESGAGEKIKSGVDQVTGVPIYSLHGQDRSKRGQSKPRPSMLRDVDVLVYDIQDIGNRSYTYAGTMKLAMQAAKESDKQFIVLDRPNPLGGRLVSGNVADPAYVTLVGWGPVAFLYGMTCGEMAQMLNVETGINCKLTVVPMKGWTRDMRWRDTGLPWIPTSTHMQTFEACWLIAITGTIGELNVINEGVGYPWPFGYVGAPWINSLRLAEELNSRKLPGLYFRPAYFRPYYHIFKDQNCGGVEIHILDENKVMPVEAGIHVLDAINKLYPEQKVLISGAGASKPKSRSRVSMFNKVMGGNTVRTMLLEGKSAEEVIANWAPARDKFAKDREQYFLYK